MKELFKRVKIEIIDGDDRLNISDQTYRNNFESMLLNGMRFYPIQIFHYAAPHYVTRHNRPSLRFLNALLEGGPSIEVMNGQLYLNGYEGRELKKNSTEILAVGLSNLCICTWFNINTNRIIPIETSGKRCDFEFKIGSLKYVYEVKGRKDQYNLKGALMDSRAKKIKQIGDEKLALICHLPRNGSNSSIHIFDPIIENGEGRDSDLSIILYYLRIIRLSGLFILAGKLEEKINDFESHGVWNTAPIEYDEKVKKMIWEFNVQGNSYYSLRSPSNSNFESFYNEKYELYFGVQSEIINMIERWDIEGLKKFEGSDFIDEGNMISCKKDGSLMIFQTR